MAAMEFYCCHAFSISELEIEQERILKEYIEGDTINYLVLQEKMESEYFDQIYGMCSLLYSANTNIDYFPTNFVAQNEEMFYIDYECNEYME